MRESNSQPVLSSKVLKRVPYSWVALVTDVPSPSTELIEQHFLVGIAVLLHPVDGLLRAAALVGHQIRVSQRHARADALVLA